MKWLGWFRNEPKDQASERLDFRAIDVKSYKRVEPFRTDDRDAPTRQEAVAYPPFARAVGLIANKSAELICNSLRVVNEAGDAVESEQAKKAISLLTKSPDGYQSGGEFIRQLMFDYLVVGNAIVHIERSMTDKLMRLTRMDASNARIMIGKQEWGLAGLVYHVTPIGFYATEIYPQSKIAHARFVPFSDYYLSASERQFMSDSPLRMLKKAILIGKYADNWVADFFNSAAKSNLAINLPQKMTREKQEDQIKAYEFATADSRRPLVLFDGATITEINPNPQDSDVLSLREYGVKEVGRFYGLPHQLLGVDKPDNIEILSKIAYKYGIKQHIDRLLDSLGFRMLPMNQRFDIDPLRETAGDTAAMVAMADLIMPTNNSPALGSVEEARKIVGLTGDYNDNWPAHSTDGPNKPGGGEMDDDAEPGS